MLKLRYILICIVFLLTGIVYSQVTVSGRIVDDETETPIPGAVVMQKDTKYGTATDSSGYFSLPVFGNAPYTLIITHLAYKKFELVTSKTETRGKALVVHLIPIAHTTDEVIVTGNKTNNKFGEINSFTGTLNGKELDKALSGTLAQTVKDETGVSVRSMGPAPARPVIRGLGGDRISINEDGFSSVDLSATSPDHAVAIDPFTTYKIEVIRGPRVLLENFSALGGIINVIKETIPSVVPSKVTGMAGIQAESVNSGISNGFSLKIPYKSLSFYSEGAYRNAGDQKTPSGVLKNSSINNYSYAAGSSFQFLHGYAGASLREFNSEYRVPGGFTGAHPNGVRIVFFKREINAITEYGLHHPYWEKLTLKASRNFFSQQEFETKNIIGAEFGVLKYEGSAQFDTRGEGAFREGSITANAEHREFSIGGYVFTAPVKSNAYSLAFYQPVELSGFLFELSGRYGYAEMKPERIRANQKPEYVNARHFNVWSLAFSGLYNITSEFSIGTALNRSTRIPTIEELYSEGPHLAAYSYETGNPSLQSELGIGSEIFLHYSGNSSEFHLAGYFNQFSYFITPRNTGRINSQTLLTIYSTSGIEAVTTGAEFLFKTSLPGDVNLKVQGDYTFGKNTSDNAALPQIPPAKGRIEISKEYYNVLLTAETEFAAAQKRTDIFETATAGYIVYNFSAQYSAELIGLYHNISLSVTNIANAEYRNHLSRVKIIMPEAGRNIKLLYKLYF